MHEVSRRRVLHGATAGAALAAVSVSGGICGPAHAQSARKTFVLVHGAFSGSWIWRRVSDRLEQGGHKVFVPTLTGLGERSHLLSKDVVLDTHIADVANLLKWENLETVCLVVHSYGGFVGSGALELIGDRVSSAVWIDAWIPTDGQRAMELSSEVVRKALQAAADKGNPGFGGTGRLPPIFISEQDRSFVESKFTPQPVGTYLQPIKVSGALQKVAKKTYIRLPKNPQPFFDKSLADCKSDKTWVTLELPNTGHIAMLDAPDRITELILQAA